jgi:Tol biopolymer transport system component
MTLSPGTRLGPYEILAQLGAGGMGEVYRAKDSKLKRDVAIKVLPQSLAAEPDALARFEREALAVAALSHPNILSIFDFGTHDEISYAVMELLEGETLRDSLNIGPLPSRKSLAYVREIAEGLAAAHEKGIVHRDLKPENLFITREGHVKILDFGLAKRTEHAKTRGETSAPTASKLTEAGIVMGTVRYMSPEQVRGEAVDHRSDIFSFGAVLYEMLTGRQAFGRETTAESMTAILREDPPEIATSGSGPSPALQRIVQHCLEKKPGERFQSARDLAFAVEAVMAASTGAALPAPSTTMRRASFGLLGAGALLLAAASGFLLARLLPRRASVSYARPARVASGSGRQFGPAISPDGKWVAYLEESGGRVDVFTRFLAGGDAVNLTARSGLDVQQQTGGGGLEISPDGTQVLFMAGPAGGLPSEYVIWAVPAPLGGPAHKRFSGALSVRFSPDGQRVVLLRGGGSRGDALVVADATGENVREILKAEGAVHAHWPAWSRDGRFVYYIRSPVTGNSEPSEIWRVPADGGRAEPFISTPRRAVFPVPLADGLLYAANPDGVELALYFRPFGRGSTRRLTTGLGSFAELRATPDGSRLVSTFLENRERLVLYPLDGEPSRTIGDPVTGDRDPAVLPNGRLVFSSARSGARNLWTSALDGSDPRPLTTDLGFDECPAVSPDGRTVAFVSDRDGSRGIWTVPIDGGAPHLLRRALVHDQLAFSSDGHSLLFSAPGGELPALFRVALPEGTLTKIPTPGSAHAPATSPRGDLVAYLDTLGSVYAGGPPRPVVTRYLDAQGAPALVGAPDAPWAANGRLAFSQDGRRLAIASNPGSSGGAIWVGEPGSSFRKLTTLPPGIMTRGVAFTADGAGLVVSEESSAGDVVLLSREE